MNYEIVNAVLKDTNEYINKIVNEKIHTYILTKNVTNKRFID